MEIGSKTADKTLHKPTDTTKIMVTWPWTNSKFELPPIISWITQLCGIWISQQ